MPIKNPFKLQKLKIFAYKDRERTKQIGTFEAMFNPESYSLKYENKFEEAKTIGNVGGVAKWTTTGSDTLQLKLILDNTGVGDYGYGGFAIAAAIAQFRKKWDIDNRVAEFLKLTTFVNGDIHEPNYLTVEWGNLAFECRVENVEVTYELFNRSGKPIRAELEVTFKADSETSKRHKKIHLTSPDLTHIRTVKSGDTLPLMAYNIYNDPSYYIQVARANKLNSVRKLTIGQTIKFPPLNR